MKTVAVDSNAASGGNVQLKKFIEEVDSNLTKLTRFNGLVPMEKCPACQFTVTGLDGQTTIVITNPNQAIGLTVQQNQARASIPDGVTPTHELRSSLSPNFDSSGDVVNYGPDTKTTWNISDFPNQQRYWQLRSSIDNGNTWNKWQDYIDTSLGGIVPIWSGQVRSTTQMPNCVLNVANYATVDSTFDGTSCTIRVYGSGGPGTGWLRLCGSTYVGVSTDSKGNVVPYPSASLTGYLPGTYYSVYYDIINKIYRVFTHAESAQALADTYVYAGEITTVSSQVSIAQGHALLSGTSVSQIIIDAGGSGYTSAPTVVIEGGTVTGGGATATAVLGTGSHAGQVASVTVTNGGSGFTVSPTITFTGGGGSGAAAVAVLEGTSVASIGLTLPGSGYLNPPTVIITGGGGYGAYASTQILSGAVVGITLLNGGTGYTSAPTVLIGSGGGTAADGFGATARLVYTGYIVTVGPASYYEYEYVVTVVDGGSGYQVAPTLYLQVSDETTPTQFVMGTTIKDGKVTGFTGGTGRYPANVLKNFQSAIILSGGFGSGASASAQLTPTSVDTILVTAPGAAYTSAPAVAIGTSGSGAAATCQISGGSVVSTQVTNGGSGYTSPPPVTFVGGIGGKVSSNAAHSTSLFST